MGEATNRCTVAIVVSGVGADKLALDFVEAIKKYNCSIGNPTISGCSYTMSAFSEKGEKIMLGHEGQNGLAVSGEFGAIELY